MLLHRIFFGIFLSTLLVGCGGSDLSGNSTPGTPGTPPANSVVNMSTRLLSCPNDWNDNIDECSEINEISSTQPGILAVTLTLDGAALASEIVKAEVTKGALNIDSSLTNTQGIAFFTITANGAEGASRVTATSDAADQSTSDSLNFNIGYSSISISIENNTNNTSIAQNSTALITVTLTSDGDLYTTPVAVSFTSACSIDGTANLDAEVLTVDGVAQATYQPIGCVADDVITATTEANSLSASTTVNIANSPADSVLFISATPNTLAVKGTGGRGRQETSKVLFRVVDQNNLPSSLQEVEFELERAPSGATINPITAITNSNGEVYTVVSAGAGSGPLKVKVKVSDPDLIISNVSSELSVSTGLPDQDSFSISLANFSPEVLEYDGDKISVSVQLADHHNNAVPDGTTVFFHAEAGAINDQATGTIGSCTTSGSGCSVNWVSGGDEPAGNMLSNQGLTYGCSSSNYYAYAPCINAGGMGQPYGGRVTITAFAEGEENFIDNNHDGLFTQGELFTDDNCDATYTYNEPFVDSDNNGVYTAAETYTDSDNSGNYTFVEAYEDENNDGLYTKAETFTDSNNDGIYNEAEQYTDSDGNNAYTYAEAYIDSNGDGQYTYAEVFVDSNNNGHYDSKSEDYIDSDGNGEYTDQEIFTDNDNDGKYTSPEAYVDSNKDGIYTPPEPYTDTNKDGIYNTGEPYTDTNNDNTYFIGDPYTDADGNGRYSPGDAYQDSNNDGHFTLAELYTDSNNDGLYTYAESFTDSNGNNAYDSEEPYTETIIDGIYTQDENYIDSNGDGKYTIAEQYNDANGDGKFNKSSEPYTDSNGDGKYNDTAEQYNDANGDGKYTEAESFTDLDGNGVYTVRDTFIDANGDGKYTGDTFVDKSEVFYDFNEDGLFKANRFKYNGTCNVNVDLQDDPTIVGAQGEDNQDINGDGLFTFGNLLFNGLTCSENEAALGNCERELVHVSDNIVLIMASKKQYIRIMHNKVETINADLTTATGQGTVGLQVYFADIYNNRPPANTTISVSTTNGTLSSDGSFIVPSSNALGPYYLPVVLTRETEPNELASGILSITITTPKGTSETFSISVSDDG